MQMNQKEIIEIKSERAREVIGQIPGIITRFGISLFFIIIVGFFIGTYFFEYENVIKTSAIIDQSYDTTVIQIKIPPGEIEKIKSGQKVILSFDNIPNLYEENTSVHIQNIPEIIHVTEREGFYLAKVIVLGIFLSDNGKVIKIEERIEVTTKIICGKDRFLNKIIKPFFSVL